MSEALDRATARLANLEAMEPLLNALRVLSLSSMQMTQNRMRSVENYAERFTSIAQQLVNLSATAQTKSSKEEASLDIENVKPQKSLLIILGSVRGICGAFNRILASKSKEVIQELHPPNGALEVWAFGSRLQTKLQLEDVAYTAFEPLISGSLPDEAKANQMMRSWLSEFESGELASVDVLSYRPLKGTSSYQPEVTRLLPYEQLRVEKSLEALPTLWPDPIVEGDAESILEKIERHLIAIKFYKLLLETVAAENTYRFQTLEQAKDTTADLIEELTLEIMTEKRHATTKQIHELTVGAGLIGRR
jgi:ATP synthase F1 gamma subunit